MTRYLHTMIRVTDPDATIRFFELIGLKEVRRFSNEKGRFTLIFLAPEGQEDAQVELTYNWPEEDGSAEEYTGVMSDDFMASLHPDDVAKVEEAVRRSLEDGAEYNIDYRIIPID